MTVFPDISRETHLGTMVNTKQAAAVFGLRRSTTQLNKPEEPIMNKLIATVIASTFAMGAAFAQSTATTSNTTPAAATSCDSND